VRVGKKQAFLKGQSLFLAIFTNYLRKTLSIEMKTNAKMVLPADRGVEIAKFFSKFLVENVFKNRNIYRVVARLADSSLSALGRAPT
jgi:hypothetical protein